MGPGPGPVNLVTGSSPPQDSPPTRQRAARRFPIFLASPADGSLKSDADSGIDRAVLPVLGLGDPTSPPKTGRELFRSWGLARNSSGSLPLSWGSWELSTSPLDFSRSAA